MVKGKNDLEWLVGKAEQEQEQEQEEEEEEEEEQGVTRKAADFVCASKKFCTCIV